MKKLFRIVKITLLLFLSNSAIQAADWDMVEDWDMINPTDTQSQVTDLDESWDVVTPEEISELEWDIIEKSEVQQLEELQKKLPSINKNVIKKMYEYFFNPDYALLKEKVKEKDYLEKQTLVNDIKPFSKKQKENILNTWLYYQLKYIDTVTREEKAALQEKQNKRLPSDARLINQTIDKVETNLKRNIAYILEVMNRTLSQDQVLVILKTKFNKYYFEIVSQAKYNKIISQTVWYSKYKGISRDQYHAYEFDNLLTRVTFDILSLPLLPLKLAIQKVHDTFNYGSKA